MESDHKCPIHSQNLFLLPLGGEGIGGQDARVEDDALRQGVVAVCHAASAHLSGQVLHLVVGGLVEALQKAVTLSDVVVGRDVRVARDDLALVHVLPVFFCP